MAVDLGTDQAWEEWGRRDPYFGVVTHPKFRRHALTVEARQEFFGSGEVHVRFVLDYIRHFIDREFKPTRVLDFGCGVGRTLIAMAAAAPEVVGVDVAPSMLEEARLNCAARGVTNVTLSLSDDTLSTLTGDFDLIHSCIVFQHIPVERGRAIFAGLLRLLRPGGIGAVHVTYAKTRFADSHGADPSPPPAPGPASAAPAQARPQEPDAPPAPEPDPEMQMNSYNLNEILFCLQQSGIVRFHVDFTDHGGELGVFLFFQKPAAPASAQGT